MEKNNKVSLGCGTLILIALIVLLFSNPGISDLEDEVNELRSEIRELNTNIERLESKIDVLIKDAEENPDK